MDSIPIDQKLMKLAKYITKRACSNWHTYLRYCKDEVLSQALVAAVQSNDRYPNSIGLKMQWTKSQADYAFGFLIAGLKTSRILPHNRKYGVLVTNVEWPEELDDNGFHDIDNHDEVEHLLSLIPTTDADYIMKSVRNDTMDEDRSRLIVNRLRQFVSV